MFSIARVAQNPKATVITYDNSWIVMIAVKAERLDTVGARGITVSWITVSFHHITNFADKRAFVTFLAKIFFAYTTDNSPGVDDTVFAECGRATVFVFVRAMGDICVTATTFKASKDFSTIIAMPKYPVFPIATTPTAKFITESTAHSSKLGHFAFLFDGTVAFLAFTKHLPKLAVH